MSPGEAGGGAVLGRQEAFYMMQVKVLGCGQRKLKAGRAVLKPQPRPDTLFCFQMPLSSQVKECCCAVCQGMGERPRRGLKVHVRHEVERSKGCPFSHWAVRCLDPPCSSSCVTSRCSEARPCHYLSVWGIPAFRCLAHHPPKWPKRW